MSMSEKPFEKAPFPLADCLFYGLHATKGHGRKLFNAIIVPYGLLLLLLYAAMYYFMGQFFSDMSLVSGDIDNMQPSEIFSQVGSMLGANVIIMLFSLVIMSSGMNAAYRWYLDKNLTGQIGALRFGADEFRTVGVLILYGLLVFMLPYLSIFVVMVLAVALKAVLPSVVGSILAGLLMLVSIVGMFASMVYLSVKLSLCVPLSLQRKKITMFDSMRLTKGRGWALLGAYAIIGLVYFVITMVLSSVQNMVFMGRIMPMLGDPDILAGDSFAMFQAMADMFTSPDAIMNLMVLVGLYAIFAVVSLFAYTGLTSFSLTYLQKERGDI
jgi:hypothetical protein